MMKKKKISFYIQCTAFYFLNQSSFILGSNVIYYNNFSEIILLEVVHVYVCECATSFAWTRNKY